MPQQKYNKMETEVQLNAHNKQEYPPMHTCEHIINQTMIRLFHCGRSVSAHIERKKSKLDYALPAAPTDEDITRIENAVNEVISRNLEVTTEWMLSYDGRNQEPVTLPVKFPERPTPYASSK